VDNVAVAREKISDILDFWDKDGNDIMQAEIDYNYNRIKADVKQRGIENKIMVNCKSKSYL